ncbi:hypothetical protein SLEP1_g37765 [Rubroshorea leprosula]|uniref:GDSL esterase/lipase n=1 Tax=Rubroshorea leprosula TaxID=152421 RepID=A0AAV5KW36_9ROSI|nr:hypothetical protein SLEP1_g37765 [Rubroshorea leprosula]
MGEIILVFVVAVLMGMSGVAKGQFAQTHFIHNGSKASAMFVLGDSSVDCGENTLFYPFLHENLSLLPCNGSDSTLLPSLLGTTIFLFLKLSVLHFSHERLPAFDLFSACIFLSRIFLEE